MNTTVLKVRYSQLHPGAIVGELLERYELKEPVSCRFYDNGLNDIYIVNTGKETYFLRISLADIHVQQDYEEETSIINLLNDNDISVATPVCCKDGSYVWKVNAPEGIRYVVLFTEAIKKPSENAGRKAFNLGCMVAKMHIISDKKDFVVSRTPIDLEQLSKKPLEKIKSYMEHRPADYEFLYNGAEKLCHYIEDKLSYQKPDYGFCHGDIHSENVFFNGDNPMLFDFDCMGYGWRAYDVCIYAWNKTFEDENYIESDEWKAYLNGYNSIRQLSLNELSSINAFAALRELWLIGLHADVMEKNAGCNWYNDGYFDYHMGKFKLWYERTFALLTI